MKYDLSNKVIARLNETDSARPKRSLDLGNIVTPELGLLSPNRNEIAPRGRSREIALQAYSERLRNSYKQNEGGLRDGMVMLGEAFRNGQSISISCFCRAGQMCHADVVKIAIEKVSKAISVREMDGMSRGTSTQASTFRPSNPRTERAINQILAVSSSDLALSRLDDTDGRNRIDHASRLNATSQFLRDTYERGGTVRNGVLIVPNGTHQTSSPLKISTVEYGLKRLEPLIGSEKAREVVPQLLEYGKAIAGSDPDRETVTKAFRWIYDSLEGKQEFLDSQGDGSKTESVVERFDRTLTEIAEVAGEMDKLEPSDRSISHVELAELVEYDEERSIGNDTNEIERSNEDRVQGPEYENAHTTTGFERVELDSSELTLLASEMSADEIHEWSKTKFPALDDALENGIKPSVIMKLYKAKDDKTTRNGADSKALTFADLRFAQAYIEHQLSQPETRQRHYNERYRDYAQRLDMCRSREEVMEVASKIRVENAANGLGQKHDVDARSVKTPPPLTAREIQMLFTEQSPRHYSSEMIVAKLDYAVSGKEKRAKTEALLKGEISRTPEAQRLIDSLESRMERKYLNESLSATKHFLKSLNTSNNELRLKNGFDHSELYKRLAPAEKDYIFEMATWQKDQLEATVQTVSRDKHLEETHRPIRTQPDLKIEKLREELKMELESLSSSGAAPNDVEAQTSRLLNDHLDSTWGGSVDKGELRQLSQELSEIVIGGDLQRTRSFLDIHTKIQVKSERNHRAEPRDFRHEQRMRG